MGENHGMKGVLHGVDGLLFLLLLNGRQCKAGRERLTPNQSEDPSPIVPTYRKKEEKGKTVEDTKGESS